MLFMQYGPSVPEFYDLTKDESTGVIYNLLGGLILSPKNVLATNFLEIFKNEYGVESGSYGYMLYLSVYMYTEALKIVGNPTDHTAIGKALGNSRPILPWVLLNSILPLTLLFRVMIGFPFNSINYGMESASC